MCCRETLKHVCALDWKMLPLMREEIGERPGAIWVEELAVTFRHHATGKRSLGVACKISRSPKGARDGDSEANQPKAVRGVSTHVATWDREAVRKAGLRLRRLRRARGWTYSAVLRRGGKNVLSVKLGQVVNASNVKG